VGVYGWAYRENVKEDAFTVARRLVDELANRGAEVVVDDPLYTHEELAAKGLTPYQSGSELDAAVIQAMHAEYADHDWATIPGLKVLLDGRNSLRGAHVPESVQVVGVGRN